MNLSQRQLRFFVAAGRARTLSEAARTCHLSQPAFSRALAALEAGLGVRLFHRTTRQFALTPQGLRLLPVAQRLVADLDEFSDLAADDTEAVRGVVSVAVGTAFGACVLPAALETFIAQCPAVQVRVIDANSRDITAQVVTGAVDFGIGSVVGAAGELTGTPLLGAALGIIVSPRHHRLAPRPAAKDLLRLPFIKETEDTSIMNLLREAGSPLVERMAGGIEASSLSLQLAMVAAGLGASVVSVLGASHPLAQALRFVPLRPRIQRHLQLLRRTDRPLRPAARILAEHVVRTAMTVALNPGVQRLAGATRPVD